MATNPARGPLSKLSLMLRGLGDPDLSPAMIQWEKTIVEGNRRGVLSGVDGYNQPFPPLKYRMGKGRRTAMRRGKFFGTVKHEHQIGPLAAGLHGNLTTAEYQQLTGPRLAPRRDGSRVITNLHTQHGRDGAGGNWFAEGAWFDVVSVKGVPFLGAHFKGRNRLPKYDLRPIRPEDRLAMATQLRTYIGILLKQQG